MTKALSRWLTASFCVVLASASLMPIGQPLQAQETGSAGEPGIQLGPTVESTWEFGMEVNASAPATGVFVTVPLPMDWPEQQVEIIKEHQTDNISQLKISNKTKWTRQLEFRINRMAAGQSEAAFLRFRVQKRMISAPEDVQQFKIPKRVKATVKGFLIPSPQIESKHPRIRELADELRDESLSAWDQVEKNFRWVRENIEYKFDRTNRSCLEALENKIGDCGELSSLFIAICRAQKIPARAVWIPDHTYPEFYLEDAKGNGHWFPCQAAGTYEFGAMSEIRPILQKGDRFRMPGKRQPVRYVEPTLIARDAKGPIAIKFIRRQVGENQISQPPQ